jgi:chromosome partitioning protein
MPAYLCAIGNQKGGVSKTTNCVHLAAALAELQRQVLIIDLDANAGATRHFGIPPESYLGGHVSDLYLDMQSEPEFIPIDKQSDDEVMHLNRFGKTDRLTS